ncbi:acyl-coenzyme A synthetase ACSM3, mitochondrial-like [Acropora millepora]|uniref:acyl-coenzyme A synthetase ACSM3, mitochondrial-like n=1 Tax=Acropora millepora TaxID=45264 RepID=UPI001CF5E856|nr:acyl-coenzyme A synthetase ACSM3, mitochondrial-like [Acropora millepora]
MRGLLSNSAIAVNKSFKSMRLPPTFRESARAFNDILFRWSSGHAHVVTPPVFDSKVGFTDYGKERREFSLEVPEYFNFANVIDKWTQKDKLGLRNPRHPAFWWVDDKGHEIKWSFEQLTKYGKRTANVLSEAGQVQRGDRVMVILPRLPEWWLLNIACLRTGTIICPGSVQLRARDIKWRLLASHATCIITDANTAETVDQVAKFAPSLKTKLLVGERKVETRNGWLPFKELFENVSSSSEHECARTRSDEPMTVYFTSGTTGHPKMAEHSHASCGLGHITTGKYWLDLTTEDIHWNISDTGWAKSAYSSFFGPWIQGSCVFVYHKDRFESSAILDTLQKYPISTFCSAPTAYRMMIQEDLGRYKFPKLRHCLSAGEPLNPEVMDRWREATGLQIREGYGQSETTLLCGSFRCLENRPGSMGKPAPGFDLKIVDDKGNDCSARVEGEIVVQTSPNRPVGLFSRYVDDPERTASVLRDNFLWTGDRGFQDEDGYFYFVGRTDDVILSAGYRIGPFEVESALIEHDAVAEAAVVSSPDSVRGEVVKAFIILSPHFTGHKESLVKELQDHVKETTAPYKYPRKIQFVDSLPKTVSGKIRRVELRQKEWSA